MKRIHAIMRPQDFRANRLLLLCTELNEIFDLNLVLLSDSEGEQWPPCPEETGWTLPFTELSCRFSNLDDPEECSRVMQKIVGDNPSSNDIGFFSCEFYLPLLKYAKRELSMQTWYDQREIFIYGIGGDIPAEETERLRVWERQYLPYVDFVTTVDSHEEFWARRYEGYGLRTHVLFDVPSLKPELVAHSRRMIGERDMTGPIDLVMIGGIRINQGLEELVDALETLPGTFRLHLIGLVNAHFKKTFDALVAAKGRSGLSVHYRGWMPYDQLVETIGGFHLGLMLKQPDKGQYGLIARGNSRKPFTYMHAGMPCIVPDFKSVCMQITEEGAGLRLDVSDPAEVARGITDIVSDEDHYRRLCENSLNAVENTYHFEREWQRLHEQVKDVFK